ncbi:hypothetical protein Tco_0911715 [Tanacetum coccineum]|uniref:Polyprotein n=1 Tax=Tanacetum coccineum TaxID=301880 RepID=A0ABQ5CWI8_9ASTR
MVTDPTIRLRHESKNTCYQSLVGCTHIHVLGDGAQMLGVPCLKGRDDEKNLLGWRPIKNVLRGWVNFEVTHPGADIVSVLRPTKNVLRGWVNFEVTHPGADIVSVLRPTKNVLCGWVNFEVTHPGSDVNKLVDFLDCPRGRAIIGCPGGRAVISCPRGRAVIGCLGGRAVIRSSAGNVASKALT